MWWQSMVVGMIIFAAFGLTVYRIVQMVRTPASKCHGCSGCKLDELRVGKGK